MAIRLCLFTERSPSQAIHFYSHGSRQCWTLHAAAREQRPFHGEKGKEEEVKKGRKTTKAKFTLESFTLTPVSSRSILHYFRGHKQRPLEYVILPTADEGWLKAAVEGKKEE